MGWFTASLRYFPKPKTTNTELIMHRSVLVIALAALAACSRSSSTTPSPADALPVAATDLRRDLFAFAADSFGGRETGTPYSVRAARFLASRLVALGVEPAGDSLYLQRVPLIR